MKNHKTPCEVVAAKIPVVLRRKLEQIAKEEDRSVSSVIRRTLEAGLQR